MDLIDCRGEIRFYPIEDGHTLEYDRRSEKTKSGLVITLPTEGQRMINFSLPEAPIYWAALLPVLGLILFSASRCKSTLRDRAFKKEAKELLDALDAERRKHITLYSVHREIERRRVFDDSSEKNQTLR